MKEAREFIHKGDALADNLMAREPENALPYSYKGVFYGFKMGVNKWKAVKAGPESMRLINKAYKMDSVNVQVIADKANMLYYVPKLFGGNKEEALCLLEKAIRMLEISGNTTNNWFYLNLLTLYAQYCQEQGDIEKTLLTYTKIMKIEPGYTWVRDELYPATLQSNKN
ncbi:MAG: hypothetical protein LIO97_10960 [Tannerellaceae bacterium]|nr:hypothetical protein [Tannerellaceae bacterium]